MHPPIQRVQKLSPTEVKRPVREADRFCPSKTEVNNIMPVSSLLICLHGNHVGRLPLEDRL